MKTKTPLNEKRAEKKRLAEEKRKLAEEKKRLEKEELEKNKSEVEKELDRKEKEKKEKSKPKDVKSAAKRLISYITRQKVWLFVVAVLVVLSTAVSVCTSLVMQPVYQAIEDVVVKNSDASAAMASIVKWLVVMAAAYTVSSLMSLAYTRIMLSVSVKTLSSLRRDLFSHIQKLPIGFFDKKKTGEIMSRFTSDVSRVSDLVSSSFPTLISSTIQAVMTITIMIIYSWQITLTITVAIILMMAVVMVITQKCSPLFKKQQVAMGECNGYIEEYIKGIKAVKIFCLEDETKETFRRLNENYRVAGVKGNIISGTMRPIMSMITRINYAAAVSLGAYLVIRGKMTVPKLATYLQFVGSYGSPVASIASCYSSLISALAGAERIFEIIDTPAETNEGKITLAKTVKSMMGFDEENEDGELSWKIPEDGGFRYVPVNCAVEIKNVSFEYDEGVPVLKNVSASAESGEKLAFVGSTGAGKTTITNLINRFYEIEDGEILIDGISIKDIEKSALRSVMAFVLQDSKLFAGTIAENIRYGKLDATDEEVKAAAKFANAHLFIEKLPDGYETEIRADGNNISAGQAQLLSIARAAIADKPLLVLDEATSSVDTRTERLIEKGMDKLMQKKTVLVIAHRLSTVRNSDDILVLEGGEVIENGTHEQLILLAGKYYQLYTGKTEMT